MEAPTLTMDLETLDSDIELSGPVESFDIVEVVQSDAEQLRANRCASFAATAIICAGCPMLRFCETKLEVAAVSIDEQISVESLDVFSFGRVDKVVGDEQRAQTMPVTVSMRGIEKSSTQHVRETDKQPVQKSYFDQLFDDSQSTVFAYSIAEATPPNPPDVQPALSLSVETDTMPGNAVTAVEIVKTESLYVAVPAVGEERIVDRFDEPLEIVGVNDVPPTWAVEIVEDARQDKPHVPNVIGVLREAQVVLPIKKSVAPWLKVIESTSPFVLQIPEPPEFLDEVPDLTHRINTQMTNEISPEPVDFEIVSIEKLEPVQTPISEPAEFEYDGIFVPVEHEITTVRTSMDAISVELSVPKLTEVATETVVRATTEFSGTTTEPTVVNDIQKPAELFVADADRLTDADLAEPLVIPTISPDRTGTLEGLVVAEQLGGDQMSIPNAHIPGLDETIETYAYQEQSIRAADVIEYHRQHDQDTETVDFGEPDRIVEVPLIDVDSFCPESDLVGQVTSHCVAAATMRHLAMQALRALLVNFGSQRPVVG